jgi:putative transposase
LGSSEFVESLLDEAEEREKETLRLRGKLTDLGSLARPIVRDEGITEAELRSGSRRKKIIKARRRLCELAIMKLGYPGAQVARFLGVTTASAVRAARADEWPKIGVLP